MKWISVEDRMPELNKVVIVEGGIAIHNSDFQWVTMTGHDSGNVIQWTVTHWMPLPSPPESKNNE